MFSIPISKTNHTGRRKKIKITFRETTKSIGSLWTNSACLVEKKSENYTSIPPYIEFLYDMINYCVINGAHQIFYADLEYKRSGGDDIIKSFKVENQELCVPT